jgi:hypothetical protein
MADAYMTPVYWWPYEVALIGMIVFGFLGFKAGQLWLWAFGGTLGALSMATIASGLANAIAIPYVNAVRTRYQFIAFAAIVAVFVLVAVLLALQLSGRAAREAPNGGSAGVSQK